MNRLILLDAGDEMLAFVVITAAFVGLATGMAFLLLSRRPWPKLAGSLLLLVGVLSVAWIVLTIAHNL